MHTQTHTHTANPSKGEVLLGFHRSLDRELFARGVKRSHYTPVVVGSAEEMLREMGKRNFHAYLMDINLNPNHLERDTIDSARAVTAQLRKREEVLTQIYLGVSGNDKLVMEAQKEGIPAYFTSWIAKDWSRIGDFLDKKNFYSGPAPTIHQIHDTMLSR